MVHTIILDTDKNGEGKNLLYCLCGCYRTFMFCATHISTLAGTTVKNKPVLQLPKPGANARTICPPQGPGLGQENGFNMGWAGYPGSSNKFARFAEEPEANVMLVE
jgi:hypothetical protein